MSFSPDVNGNGGDPTRTHDHAEDDIDTSKKESLLLTLSSQVEQFKEISSAEDPCDTSQHRQKLQRQVTTKILKSIQDLLFLPLATNFSDYRKSMLSVVDDIVGALLILVDEWGKGDVQVYSALVDALTRSYASVVSSPNHARDPGLESLQHFILLDILPHVISGDTENCLDAQSMVAKALGQIICSFEGSFTLTSPILKWCRWQLDSVFLQYQFLSSRKLFPMATEPHTVLLPPEVQELGLVLLRKLDSPHQLPQACGIVLDHVSVVATCNGMTNAMLLQYATDAVSLLRQRLMDFASFRSQSINNTERRQEESPNMIERTWQLELAQLVVVALNDEASQQSELLTTAYLQELILTIQKTSSQPTSSIAKRGNGMKTRRCESGNFHPRFLALDWIVISFLFSKSSISSKQNSLLFEVCDSLSELDHGTVSCCPFSPYQSLNSAMEVVLLRHHDRDEDYLHSSSLTSEIPSSVFEFDTLENGIIQQELVFGFLSLHVALLLSSARAIASRIVELTGSVSTHGFSVSSTVSQAELFPTKIMLSMSWVHDLTLNFFERMDSYCQKEFVSLLLQLVDETALLLRRRLTPERTSKFTLSDRPCERKMISHLGESLIVENDDMKVLVLRLVCSILQCLAEKSPKSFIYFKDEIIQRLLQPTFEEKSLNNEVVRPFCKILVSLLSFPEHVDGCDLIQSLHFPEVLLLLQKLLFGEPARLGTSRVVRGIFLATELLEVQSSNLISMENRICIQEWVLQCLLPSTRRMVDPEIGLSGLLFLQSWIGRNDICSEKVTNATVFHHFKMIVANTGLIQMVDTYQSSGNSSATSLFGYSSREMDQPNPRAMLFGIHFFLRHAGHIESSPGRWKFTTDWVYALVDTYLHIGRSTAKNWQSNNWLLASLEFPVISTSCFKRSVDAQNLVVEWIGEHFCRFDVSAGIQAASFLPSTHADTIVRCLSSKALRQLIDSAKILSLALLVGIALSAAVLRNAWDHAVSLETNLRIFQPVLKTQIAKIYDLRAKSVTIDSFLTAIGSALRRSLLRKKRATVILSDESSDASRAEVPVASVRTIQDNNLLMNIGSTVIQNRCLRSSIFGSLNIVRYDIVWEVLMDLEDCNILHSFFESMFTQSDFYQSDDAVLKLLRVVDIKLNVTRHVIIHLESSALLDFSVKESYIGHCMSEICFLLDGLIQLRRKCIDVTELKINAFNRSQHLLSNFVNLSVSYLRILSLILKRSHYHGSADRKSFSPVLSVPFDECLKWCDGCLHHKNSQTCATPILRLFDFFSAKLTVTENFVVAYNILDILSLLAFSDEVALLSRLVELSWTSLHTVYDTEITTTSSCPYAVTIWRLRFGKNVHVPELQPLVRIVQRIFSKLDQRGNKIVPEFACLRLGLIRHWGLLNSSDFGASFVVKHLSSLILSLKSLVESLDVALLSSKRDDGDEKDSEAIHSKKRKTCHASSLVGLEVATMSDYFDTLLNLLVATAGSLNPGERSCNSHSSPYKIYEECYSLYRNMIEIYQASIFAFPRRSAAIVTCASKDMLSIAYYQLQRCIDWRNQHPLLSNEERASGQRDIGSIRYLQQLIDATMGHTAVPILRLCEVWQSSTVVGYMKVSRIATMRLIVEKAMQRMKDVALSHNLSTSVSVRPDEMKIDEPTKGFHILSRKDEEHMPEMPQMNDPQLVTNHPVETETTSDTDDSFGVIGKWGDESDSNSDDSSTCTLNIDYSTASLPRKSV